MDHTLLDYYKAIENASRKMLEAAANAARQLGIAPLILGDAIEGEAREVGKVLDSYAAGNGGSREGHVFNLGHGMSPDMNPEHVAVLVDAVHRLSRR